jgi:Ni,Fe-hydrogenase maturation factor
MKVLCFGNEFVKEDSLAKELADELKIDGVEFIKCDSLEGVSGDVVILDVVEGIQDVVLIGLNKIKDFHPVSMHDFDLGTELKLRKEIGEIKDVKIIGIPMKGDKEQIKKNIKKILQKE